MRHFLFIVFAVFSFCLPQSAFAKPTLDDYAGLPDVSYASLSPDGRYVALARPYKGKQAAFIYDIDTPGDPKVIPNPSDEIDMGSFTWHSSTHLVFKISRAVKKDRNRYEIQRLISYNVDTGKLSTLMSKGAQSIEDSNPSITNVVNTLPSDSEHILMVASSYDGRSTGVKSVKSKSMGGSDGFRLKTFKVNLSSGKAKAKDVTNQKTIDIVTDINGELIARLDYDLDSKVYSAYGKTTGKWKQIYRENTTARAFNLQGEGQTANTVVVSRYAANGYRELVEVSLVDGAIGKTLFSSTKYDFSYPLFDPNTWQIVGVVIKKDVEEYVFFDKELRQWQAELAAEFAGQKVSLTDWNAERTRFLLLVSGGGTAGEYHLFRTDDMSLSKLGSKYPKLGKADIASTISFDITASDGTKIPGYLTLPAGKTKAQGPFPTVVMPHGGPEQRDNAEFDYWAQYLASQGYAVYKPNFRGSAGYGSTFRNAGYSEFGGKMVDDVVDGTKALVMQRVAKSGKICIMGASYGGYAALAASVREPDLYACTISVNGVTNVSEMFAWVLERGDRDSRAANYWRRYMGADNLGAAAGKNKITNLWSPARQAFKLKAPVLIFHGKEDTNVPYEQFEFMRKALKREGIPFEAVVMKTNDHFLRTSEARKEVLGKSGEFLAKHLN